MKNAARANPFCGLSQPNSFVIGTIATAKPTVASEVRLQIPVSTANIIALRTAQRDAEDVHQEQPTEQTESNHKPLRNASRRSNAPAYSP